MTRQFFNHYSATILAAFLLVGGLSLVWRRGGKLTHWLILGGVTVAIGAVWWVFRPVATSVTPAAGLPLLLEVQSPYCLGCVAIKPAVDRLESELHGRLVLRRVDIQSAEGRKLARQYGIEMTPTFVFFDSSGQEQWRSVGQLDAARVRTSLAPLAKDAGGTRWVVIGGIESQARTSPAANCHRSSLLRIRAVLGAHLFILHCAFMLLV